MLARTQNLSRQNKKLNTIARLVNSFPPFRPQILALALASGLALSLAATLAHAQSEPTPAPTPAPTKQPEPVAKSPPAPRPAIAPPALAMPRPDEPLPIRKITLYRSGVGYFERTGDVTDNAEVTLRFNTDQINDILKSMVLLDLGGGRIDSVSYGSKEPLAKRLASFGINIADNPAASELLQRLRGTAVKITMPDGEFSGTIMNVEMRPTVYQNGGGGTGPAATVHNLPWINLVTATGVRSFNLANSTGFQILDAALAEELNKALGALAEYRADRTKTVDLRFAGPGKRQVMVGYVHEMPVWKTSYRLVLPELDSGGKTKGQLQVQGWAVVENTTDQDWNGVQLSLVSGRPVSFQMDLYEPLYSARPWVAVPTIPGVAPRIFGLGIDTDQLADAEKDGRSKEAMLSNISQAQAFRRMESGRMKAAASPAPASMGTSAGSRGVMESMDSGHVPNYVGVSATDMTDYAAKAAANAQTVGEIFQFQVSSPVSIERQRSAMIPILTAAVSGRRVSIFNAADGSQFPMRGV